MIPQSVVSENAAGEQYVYLATSEKEGEIIVKRVIVETGKTQGDFVEILNGLEAGNQIIVEGARSVRDNQQVKILDKVETANN